MNTFKTYFRAFVLCFSVLFALASCENEFITAKEEAQHEAKSKLNVKVRANAGGGEEEAVTFPVNVFVFDKAKNFISKQTISKDGFSVTFPLNTGVYYVYAIGGVDGKYLLSTDVEGADPKETDYYSLKAEQKHNDLMVAKYVFGMGDKEENSITLTMNRKVFLLESVVLNDIPNDVQAVEVSVTPSNDKLMLTGEFADKATSQTVSLIKSGNAKEWQLQEPVYLLPTSDKANIKVSLTQGDKVRSFTYKCEEALSENQKIRLHGTYTGVDEITLQGSIKGDVWGETKDIAFEFSTADDETVDPEPQDPDNPTVEGDVPPVGTAYKGCYVLKSEQQGDGSVVTLLAKDDISDLSFSDMASLREVIDNKLTALPKVDNCIWRVPTYNEIKYVYDNMSKINSDFDALRKDETTGKINFGNLVSSDFGAEYKYYYEKEDKTLCALSFATGMSVDELKSKSKSLILRPITTIKFNK